MITPRRTRLVRVRDLHAFRQAIVDSARTSDTSHLIVVPTAGAAAQLRQQLAEQSQSVVTRDGLYDRLHARLTRQPLRLSPYDREAIARASARDARESLATAREVAELDTGTPGTAVGAPGGNRPGLIAAMLGFYDQLKRQGQRVDRFEELLRETLERDAEFDRGASRMLWQTRFLAALFRAYEQRVESSGAYDEHSLRQRLLTEPAPSPLRAAIITVADWIAEPGGLYPVDFDLIARLPGLEAVDVIVTETILQSGFHERVHHWLPGVEEVGFEANLRERPRLVTPAAADRLYFTARDREEELIEIVRRSGAAALRRAAVVYQRPLPYLYLAHEVLGGAGIRFRTCDTVPLAVEPCAAALDLVLELVSSSFTRASLIAVLRSPHFVWSFGSAQDEPFDAAQVAAGEAIPRVAVSALDRWLSEERYLGDVDRLTRIASDGESIPGHAAALPAMRASLDAVRELAPLALAAPASEQIERVIRFLATHRPPADGVTDRERRARAAIVKTLEGIAAASRSHDDSLVDIDGVASLIRRSIEEQTFAVDDVDSGTGLWLADTQAVRYGNFDSITIVGLVQGEWPDPPQRNIFYPQSLLNALGWPSKKDWRRGAEARFLDLLASPAEFVTLSTITLDNEALVETSGIVDEVPRAGLSTMSLEQRSGERLFLDELLSIDPPLTTSLDDESRAAAEARLSRSPAGNPEFHGQTDAVSRAWSVSAVETYLDCPFKFFARHVLKLQEEPEDEEVMDPRRQGELVHEVFETFFDRWQSSGRQAITSANLDEARAVFAEVVEECVRQLPDTEAALERTRLLGSSAAAGLGEAVFRMEAERSIGVSERLLEQRLEGCFTFQTTGGPRAIALRGKADRLDLLDDGTFRLIDYKLGWPPNRTRALQLPVYSLCAEQRLDGRNGRTWRLAEAAYIAFKGPKRVVPLFSPADRDRVLREAQQRLVDAVDAIERGEFPPRPVDVYRCDTCEYSAVCRKDYAGDV